MSISSIQNIGRFYRLRPIEAAPQPQPAAATSEPTSRADLLAARRALLRLFDALSTADKLVSGRQTLKLDLAAARSDAGLGLDLSSSAASLQSREEINSTPTSFTPFGPDWVGGSTALITIGGEYTGSLDGNVSFEVRTGGTHGDDRLRIRVRSPSNQIIANLVIQPNDPLDQQYDLNNGLYLSLGAGDLLAGDTTNINVQSNVGSAVNPDNPFNGLRNASANLQFGLPSIVDGSFSINDESIAVNASDTVNTIIDRINQSAAGVTATFNNMAERIELTQNTEGSAPTIDIQGDTSNFVGVTKLLGATVVPGTDSQSETALENVAQFSSMQSGNLLINGDEISIDVQNDTLNDVLDRINQANIGVTAEFDTSSQRVSLLAVPEVGSLAIDGNGTGFFAALNMPEGRVDARGRGDGFAKQQSYRIADSLETAFDEINAFFGKKAFSDPADSTIRALRNVLDGALGSAFGNAELAARLGLNLNSSDRAKNIESFARLDRRRLTQSLQSHARHGKSFLSSGGSGLLQTLGRAVQQSLVGLNEQLGTTGTLFDGFA